MHCTYLCYMYEPVIGNLNNSDQCTYICIYAHSCTNCIYAFTCKYMYTYRW